MGQLKSEMIEAEERWNRKAEVEGIRCSLCSQRISYGDREVFFSDKKCAYCTNSMAKDN
jgi:hypothetical protein